MTTQQQALEQRLEELEALYTKELEAAKRRLRKIKAAQAKIRKALGQEAPKKEAPKPVKITKYEDFKIYATKVVSELNRDFNYDNLVPIYRMRREVGDKVTRQQFSEWMFEMQAEDLLKLQGGEMTGITPDKHEDSLTTNLGEFRYYITLY